eukprot:6057915-Pyramimonas_sp.AAC.1
MRAQERRRSGGDRAGGRRPQQRVPVHARDGHQAVHEARLLQLQGRECAYRPINGPPVPITASMRSTPQ